MAESSLYSTTDAVFDVIVAGDVGSILFVVSGTGRVMRVGVYKSAVR